MSSIYDELYRRRVSRRQPSVTESRRRDFSADRICVVEGVAISAAGMFLMHGGLPETPPIASPWPLLTDTNGFPRLAKPIKMMALSDRHLGINGRLNGIWELLAGSLDGLIRQLPDGEKVDLVISLPDMASLNFQQQLQQSLVERLVANDLWQEGQSQCRITSSISSLNALLAPNPDIGGMRWVVLCSIDTLLEEHQQGQWGVTDDQRTSLIAGEGGALILFERVAPALSPSLGRFWIHSKEQPFEETGKVLPVKKHPRIAALLALLEALVPAEPPTAEHPPEVCVMDIGMGEPAADAFVALFERWPNQYAPMVNCHALDYYNGYIGQATLAVMLMMAMAAAEDADSALLLSLGQTGISAASLLTPVHAESQA